jgi:hypothetical protein
MPQGTSDESVELQRMLLRVSHLNVDHSFTPCDDHGEPAMAQYERRVSMR